MITTKELQNHTESFSNTNEKNPEFHAERTLTLKIQKFEYLKSNSCFKSQNNMGIENGDVSQLIKSFNWISIVSLMFKDSTITDKFTLCRS